MHKASPLYKWLQTQPKEFVDEILNNERLGDETFTLEQLRELDEKHNPED